MINQIIWNSSHGCLFDYHSATTTYEVIIGNPSFGAGSFEMVERRPEGLLVLQGWYLRSPRSHCTRRFELSRRVVALSLAGVYLIDRRRSRRIVRLPPRLHRSLHGPLGTNTASTTYLHRCAS
jgi:hypothetical protein